jgi:hypothetical protein
LEACELYSLHLKGVRSETRFPKERDMGKYINVEICELNQVTNLTRIPNLVALMLSMILCFLLFHAI